jgi:hypothetical protein
MGPRARHSGAPSAAPPPVGKARHHMLCFELTHDTTIQIQRIRAQKLRAKLKQSQPSTAEGIGRVRSRQRNEADDSKQSQAIKPLHFLVASQDDKTRFLCQPDQPTSNRKHLARGEDPPDLH